MSTNVCECGVHECSREHNEAHRAWLRAGLRKLESDPKEPRGPGSLVAHIRKQLRFDRDLKLGRLSHDEAQRVWRELASESLILEATQRREMN